MYSFMGEKRRRFNARVCKGLLPFLSVLTIATIATTSYAAGLAHAQNVSRETFVSTTPSGEMVKPKRQVYARITGFNTVRAQTDASPCIAASGDDICGRNDVVACPRNLPLGSKVEISGKIYTCLDRTHSKFNGRFDISCDKDMKCPYRVTGYQWVTILE